MSSREQEQGNVRVKFHPLAPDQHELTGPTFTRHFPDLPTYERVRQHLRWDYTAIEVWTREGEGSEWKPDGEHTIYSGLWRGEKITDRQRREEQNP
jgi:hypothetical protein